VNVRLQKVISGGQTGVDRAALDVAMALNLPCGGWCPRDRRAEDGRIPDRYPLEESDSSSYSARTIQNVIDSDGTLILALGDLRGGTLLTRNAALKRRKRCLIVDLKQTPDVAVVTAWLQEASIRILNIAGPRASQAPEAYALAAGFLLKLLSPRKAEKKRRRRPKRV
jgi:Circularly permutated YpsA SLOG family